MNHKIAKLIGALQKFEVNFEADEIADWLWYAARQNRPVETPEHLTRSSQAEPVHPTPLRSLPEKTNPPSAPKPVRYEKEKETDIYLPSQQKDYVSSGSSGLPFRTPSGYGLPHARQFMRALRPLLRRIPAPSRLDLDEEATARQIADINIWLPIIKPEMVRWLDLMLVIDSSPSMTPWRQTVAEFRRMLEHQGAFRDVRVWQLKTNGSTQDVSLYTEKGNSPHHYRELINLAQPRLILVLTDCVSPAWTGDKLIRWLDAWGREHPVTLVQVLPQRLWAQTRLRMAHFVRVMSRCPATPNRQLQQLQARVVWTPKTIKERSPIPLVCLESGSVAQWAASIAGSPNVVLPGFVLQSISQRPRSPQTEIEIEERLRSFRAVASPTAFKLACFLAAAPLRLPVMRLIQRALLPDSRQEHIAEFLLSGLIRRVSTAGHLNDPDRITYDFISESIRDKLLDAGLITDAVQVQEIVSRFIADNYGSGVDFLGLIAHPERAGELLIPSGQEGFAKITAKVLKRLGEKYSEVVRILESGSHDAHAFDGRPKISLTDVIGQLVYLRSLNLSRNRLKLVPESVGHLSKLESLDLSANHLTELPNSLGELIQLRSLNLSQNRLSQIPGQVAQLSQLESLNLSANQLTDIPRSLVYLDNLKSLNLRGNPLNPELAAAYRDGLDAVKRYLRAQTEAQIVLNEAKLILVGEGEVGKSCLLDALRGDTWMEHNTTHGIEIKPVKVTDPNTGTEITLNGWDFGGQRVYRPTQQLFFSAPAVYLVVWKPREGPEQGFVKDWIRLVKHREPEAKILVVATHGGPKEHHPDLDHQGIWELFGRDTVLNFFHVDSKPDEKTGERSGVAELKDAIARVAASLPEMGRTVPARWQQAREALKQTGAAYLPLEQVLNICREHKMDEEEARVFVSISHRLGHLIHYEHDPTLRDIVVLKPNWLATAISFVLDDKQTREAHGLVSFARLSELWNDPTREAEFRYEPSLHPVLLRLMERFDLSYRVVVLGDEGQQDYASLIPNLVPDIRPYPMPSWPDKAASGDEEQSQICRIAEMRSGQTAAAEGLFFQLIVRLHKYSLGRANYAESVHWQRGLVLGDDYGARALVEHVGNDVRITVRSPYPERFLAALTYEVKWLVENFWEGLRCDVMVPCLNPTPCSGLFEVRKLIENKKRNRPEQPCPVCNMWQSIELLLHNAPAARPSPLEELLANSAEVTRLLTEVHLQLRAQPLTGPQYRVLQEALLSAFSTNELRTMLKFRLDWDLNQIAGGSNDREIVSNLIRWADSRGETISLLLAARQENPGNPQLARVAGELDWPQTGTTPIMGRFDKLDVSTQRILSQVDAAFTGLMQTLNDEAKDGPRLFSFQPVDAGFLKKWTTRKFQLTLWCEHSRLPLPALNGEGDQRGVNELNLPHEWFVKAAPFFKVLTTTLSLVLPVASSATKLLMDDDSYKRIEKELDLGQKSIEAVLKGGEKLGGWLGHSDAPDLEHGDAIRAQGSILRELHALLKKQDPSFGGLVRVQNKRQEFLWVHPQFEKEY